MINGIPTTTQHNNYHMTERSHVSRHRCCGDDDGDTDTFDMQNTLPYPLPGFFPTTLPEPYPKSKSPTRQSLGVTLACIPSLLKDLTNYIGISAS